MKKVLFLAIFALFLAIFGQFALANKPENLTLPEKAGIYEVPGRPDLKLRVFIHPEKPQKPGRPQPTTPPYTCTEEDPNASLLEVSAAGWKLPSTWKYKINFSSVPSTIGSNNIQTIINQAFTEWLNAIENKVNVLYDGQTTLTNAKLDNQNIIAWGRTPASALAISYIWYNNQGYALEVDTIMNKKYSWYWSQDIGCAYQNVYDAQNILTHELGHSFGLDDEYANDYQNHTMYGYGETGEVKKDTLTEGDKNSVRNLYL